MQNVRIFVCIYMYSAFHFLSFFLLNTKEDILKNVVNQTVNSPH